MRVRVLFCMCMGVALLGCGDDADGDGSAVSNARFKEACDQGVTLCKDDPAYGATFGSVDCSDSAIESAYAGCDEACRANSKVIIDCQVAASDCDAFAACAMP